jgi:hypothetical protein
MAERYRRPDWVRRVNAMADSVGGDVRHIVPLDGATLLAEAERSLGGAPPRGDFGDPTWRERFTRLVHALDAAPMHVVGRLLTRQELLRAVRTRLQLIREVDAHPAIVNARVVAPMVVTGPARSGTTILFELLALDPELRAPTAWSTLHPLPRPTAEDATARLAWSECEQELWTDVQPEFAAMHELRSDLPVECVTLTIPSFAGPHWMMVAQLAGDWMPDTDLMYDFHRRVLQVMQYGDAPRTWLLKTPGHLMSLEQLFATYPDAWVVQTHRDPAKTMPSTVSITALVQWMRTDGVDVEALAEVIRSTFTYGLNHSVELRTSGPFMDRFVDVHFEHLMRDPVAAVGQAYERMERRLSAAHADAIRTYLREKPKGKFGMHQYAPEDWGFTAESLRAELAPYVGHFGVALEH